MRIARVVTIAALLACGGKVTHVATIEPVPPSTSVLAPLPPLEQVGAHYEGTYVMDGDATVHAVEPELAKLPDDARKTMLEILHTMKLELVLAHDGTTVMRAPDASSREEGRWTREGNVIVLTSNKPDQRPQRCTLSADGRLTCELPAFSRLVFVRKP